MELITIIDLIQKYFGYSGFILLFLNIILFKVNEKRKWVNVLEYITFLILFVHPALLVMHKYLYVSDLDPFYYFVDACVMCPDRREHLINFGRISLYLFSISTFLYLFKKQHYLIEKLLKYKILFVYLAFYLTSIHISNLTYTIANNPIYKLLLLASQIVVTLRLIFDLREFFING
jgi:hypothetical protein